MCLCVSRESVRRRSTTVMRYPSELLQGLAVLGRALRQNRGCEKTAKESGANASSPTFGSS